MDMGATIKELRWAKEHGAVGVLKKGDKEAGKYLADPYFHDLWKEAEALDLAICFHTGSGIFDRIPTREANFAVGRLQYPVLIAFQSLIQHRIPQQFPKLRFGFIEAGCGWLPYLLYNMARRLARPGEQRRDSLHYELRQNILRDNNMFVTCQVDEDLGYITRVAGGEDNILVGSDYTHADQSMERDFQLLLRDRAKKGDITKPGLEKILYDNPKRLYAL
jgi:predicted TIM-barrel fold metal-dependent hydrolase